MTSWKSALCAGVALICFSGPALAEQGFRAPPPPYADLAPQSSVKSEAQKQDEAMKAVLSSAEESVLVEPAAGEVKKEVVKETVTETKTVVETEIKDVKEDVKEEAAKAEKVAEAPVAAAQPYGRPVGKDVCASGVEQSPVNIAQFKQNPALQKLKVAYQPVPLQIVNTGRTIQVIIPPGSKFMSGEVMYDLAHVEFHTPSEHYMDGAPYPMEMQLVHKSEGGEMAIVSVMLKLGAENPAIKKIWENIPPAAGENAPKDILFSATELLPMQGMYYTYEGSLTSPPCTEGVKWHVLQNPIELSEDQLRGFQSLFLFNARSVQPLNGRLIEGN